MKKLFSTLILLPLLFTLCSCAWAREPEPDYREMMICAAMDANVEAGREARDFWADQLAAQGEGLVCPDFDELLLLARLIHSEAGSEWLTDELRMCVGEVVLNRVASPEFPDTLEEVLAEEGQYPQTQAPAFYRDLKPSRACVQAALRLLQGERMLDRTVVFQANYKLGGGVYATFCDKRLGLTYFCLTEHPELY